MAPAADLFDLTGKVAVITGGAGGIGVVYAEALAEAGAAVVVADLDLAAATATAEDLAAKGHAVTGAEVDVRSAESAQAMVATAVEAHGGVDILINNAAIMVDLPPYGLSNMPVDEWDRVIDVNLRGPLLCTQAVIPAMEGRGGGRVVNGLSAGAFMPGGIYGVSKFALHGLTVNLASELGGPGHQRQRHRSRPGRQRERLRRPPEGLALPGRHRRHDPGQALRPARGPRRHAPAPLLPGRRLDHRPDDRRRRRLDHPPLRSQKLNVRCISDYPACKGLQTVGEST